MFWLPLQSPLRLEYVLLRILAAAKGPLCRQLFEKRGLLHDLLSRFFTCSRLLAHTSFARWKNALSYSARRLLLYFDLNVYENVIFGCYVTKLTTCSMLPSRKIFWVVIKRLIGFSRTPLFATTKWLKHVIKHVLGVCVIQNVDIQLLCDQTSK